MSAIDRSLSAASEHLDAVKATQSRVDALRYLVSLFHDADDDTIVLRALVVGGEHHGVTFGDLRTLLDLADHARGFTDANADGEIDLAQRLEGSMLADLARLDRGRQP